MTSEKVRELLGTAARNAWPQARRMSEMPYPEYWRKTAAWLEFHAPHVSDGFMVQLIVDSVERARKAEREGAEPKAWEVPEETRAAYSRGVA